MVRPAASSPVAQHALHFECNDMFECVVWSFVKSPWTQGHFCNRVWQHQEQPNLGHDFLAFLAKHGAAQNASSCSLTATCIRQRRTCQTITPSSLQDFVCSCCACCAQHRSTPTGHSLCNWWTVGPAVVLDRATHIIWHKATRHMAQMSEKLGRTTHVVWHKRIWHKAPALVRFTPPTAHNAGAPIPHGALQLLPNPCRCMTTAGLTSSPCRGPQVRPC